MARNIDLGTYTCQAVSHEIIESKHEGKEPQIGVKLRVCEGPSTGMDIFWYGNLEGGAAQFTLEALRNMGWQCNDITALDGLGSTKVIVVGKNNEYQGKSYQRWMIFPVKTPRPQLEADKLASFAERFKALAVTTETVKVGDLNAAGPLPEARAQSNGTGGTKPSDGPAAGGVQF